MGALPLAASTEADELLLSARIPEMVQELGIRRRKAMASPRQRAFVVPQETREHRTSFEQDLIISGRSDLSAYRSCWGKMKGQ
jgi:hypothetical protein